MYQLFCDSNCELWHTTVKELGLHVIRMPYVIEGEEIFYDMGENHDFKGFFDKMRAGATPKTSALNEYAYMEYFEPILAAGEDIYYITFSHQMSGTFNAMKNVIAQLKEKYPEREIRFKDSKLISLGSGFVTYYGALKYKEGATMDELDAYFDDLIAHTAMYFFVDDLTYLHRGGRISGVSKVVGNLLGVKPILYFNEEGKLLGLQGNRRLGNDILVGTFYVAGDNKRGNLCSLTEKQIAFWKSVFLNPEVFDEDEIDAAVFFEVTDDCEE